MVTLHTIVLAGLDPEVTYHFRITSSDINSNLSVSSDITFTTTAVLGPPVIITQPANKIVTAGRTASFSLAASGTSALSYQWLKNGVPIPGAGSATYTTPATMLTDNGAIFTCVVNSSGGSVTSNPATLTVTAVTDGPLNDAPGIVTGVPGFLKQVIDTTMDETQFAGAGDFDRDGDTDVVATDYVDDTVAWYENTGSGSFAKHIITAAPIANEDGI